MMRVICISDTHFPIDPNNIPDGDVLIHAGDLMYTGYPDEWYPRIDALEECITRGKFQKAFYVPGNHDFHVRNYLGIANQELKSRNITLLGTGGVNTLRYHTSQLSNGMTILGLPYVTGLPSWAYNESEEDIITLLRRMPKCDIVVSHSPPKNSGADPLGFGIDAYNWYLQERKPKLWVCGHIHEGYGAYQVGETLLLNAANLDRNYVWWNQPLVVDLPPF